MTNSALNRTVMARLTNAAGGDVLLGDVVIVSSAGAGSFTTTTTGAYSGGIIGVVVEPNGILDGEMGMVAIGGYVPKINLGSSAALGDLVKTYTVAGQATPHSAPPVTGDFGQVLATGDTPEALIFNLPIQ